MKKKIFFYLILFGFHSFIFSQNLIQISMDADYSSDVFYDCESQTAYSTNSEEWDIAFTVKPMDGSVRINDGRGVELYVYSYDILDWDSVDLTTFIPYELLYNSDTIWFGAFDIIGYNFPFDYGWGVYSSTTHNVDGNVIYIIKTMSGQYKKIMINQLNGINQQFIFTYANVDGSNEIIDTINQSDFINKGYAYYSIDQAQVFDLEPDIDTWDFVFTKYIAEVDPGVFYPVTGVLHNPNSASSKVANVDVNSVNYNDYIFSTDISTIGYDWKIFDSMSGAYIVEDSLVYFIETGEGNVYSVIFSVFEGNTNGNITFNQDDASAIFVEDCSLVQNVILFPNPISTNTLTIFSPDYNFSKAVFYDINGQKVLEEIIRESSFIDISLLSKGKYVVRIEGGNLVHLQKLLILN